MSGNEHTSVGMRGAVQGQIPSSLGRYTVLAPLARGGMATVYLARAEGPGGFERLVAIKCCHPHLRDDQDFVAMFLDEARLAARIHHPNAVATLDVSDADPLYLVMEYIEGDSLSNFMKRAQHRGAPMPFDVTLRVLCDVLTGLHAAHELRGGDGRVLNLIHRDVSPQNVLVGSDGISRITDFGIAKAEQRAIVTQEGRVKGKFAYMSPEQFRSQPLSRRSDVFAAGVVLWEALTNQPLFRRTTEAETVAELMKLEVPPPSRFVRGVPRELDAVVLRAVMRRQEDRYPTAADFADAIEAIPIARASARRVASFVEQDHGAALARLRKKVRTVSEGPVDPQLLDESSGPLLYQETTGPVPDGSSSGMRHRTGVTSDSEATEITEQHDPRTRRIRMGIAMGTLLLSGAAIGLIVAQSRGAPADHAAVPDPSATATGQATGLAPSAGPTPERLDAGARPTDITGGAR